MLAVAAFSLTTTALADDISIPTDADHPFDLKLGTLDGYGLNINSANEIDNGRNGYKATFTLDNREDADYYLLSFKAGTQLDNTWFLITITADDGTEVLSSDVPLVNNGTWTCNYGYSVKTGKMEKGRYTLVFNFISEGNNYVARLADIAIKRPLRLQPGDEVELANPDFSSGNQGWSRENANLRISNEFRGNFYAMSDLTNTGSVSQAVNSLPDGLYLLEANAFDHVSSNPDLAYDQWQKMDTVHTYLFMNDVEVPMKTVFDDRLTGVNIYRWYEGVTGNYLFAGNGACAPSSNGQQADGIALEQGLYRQSIVAAVTNGTINFGWRKTDRDRATWVIFDNFKLTYLATDTLLKTYADKLKALPMSRQARERLQQSVGRQLPAAVAAAETSRSLWADIAEQRKAVEQLLAEKRQRSPMTMAAANAIMAEAYDGYTDNEAVNYCYRLKELQQRMAYTYYNIEVEVMGTLGDLLLQQVENFSDVKMLRVSGALGDDDLTTLRQRLTNLVELDLEDAFVTELPADGLSRHSYLTWLRLPAKLKSIGRSCFYEDWSLRSVALPATLETISPYAFFRCYNIGEVVIPEGVTTLGDNAYNQSGLLSLQLPATLTTISENAFRDCQDLYSVKLNGQTTIGNSAFNNDSHLTTIKMPPTMKTIGEWAFQYCRRLSAVELNEGLENIKREAFNNNDSLRTITLPTTLTALYGSPFSACPNLSTIVCKAIMPPVLYDAAPVTAATPTVRVPVISAPVFKQTAKWADLPIEGDASLPLPQDIFVSGQYNLSWPADVSATYRPNVYMTCITDMSGNNPQYGHVSVNKGAELNAAQLNLVWDQQRLYNFVTRGWFASFINNGTARADELSVTIPMQKDFWYFITFPFDVRVGDILCSDEGKVPFVVRGYDGFKRANRQPNDTWVNLGADDVMEGGKGYIFRSTNSVDRRTNTFRFPAMQNASKPRFFTTDDVAVELNEYTSEYDFDRSWNFIGNPYPAFYDIRAMQTSAPITVYEWNQGWWGSTLKYVAYSPNDDNYILNPGQGFFMQRPLEGGTIVFRKDGRQHNTDPRPWEYYEVNAARATEPQPRRQLFNLVLCTSNASEGFSAGTTATLDRTRFVINDGATLDYEVSRDAAKFDNPDGTDLYTHCNGVHYAINERPFDDGTIRLGMRLPAAGSYTLTLASMPAGSSQSEASQGPSAQAGSITLIDRETGTETDLTASSYTFQAAAGTTEARFLVRLNGTAVTSVQSVAVLQQQTEQLFDLQGRPVANPQPGVYVRRSAEGRLQGKNGRKVIIK